MFYVTDMLHIMTLLFQYMHKVLHCIYWIIMHRLYKLPHPLPSMSQNEYGLARLDYSTCWQVLGVNVSHIRLDFSIPLSGARSVDGSKPAGECGNCPVGLQLLLVSRRSRARGRLGWSRQLHQQAYLWDASGGGSGTKHSCSTMGMHERQGECDLPHSHWRPTRVCIPINYVKNTANEN